MSKLPPLFEKIVNLAIPVESSANDPHITQLTEIIDNAIKNRKYLLTHVEFERWNPNDIKSAIILLSRPRVIPPFYRNPIAISIQHICFRTKNYDAHVLYSCRFRDNSMRMSWSEALSEGLIPDETVDTSETVNTPETSDTPSIFCKDISRALDKRVRVHWHNGKKYDGVLNARMCTDNIQQYHVFYDDGDRQWHRLDTTFFELI